MAFHLSLMNAWFRASCLSGPEDLLPPDCLRVLLNCRLDRTRGIPVSRPGLVQLTTAALGSGPVTVHSKLFGAAATFSYAQVGAAVVRLNATWADASKVTLGSGLPSTVLSDTNFLDGQTIPHKFLVGPLVKKDNGTLLSNIGIVQPADPPASAVLGTRSRVSIHSMDGVGGWTAVNTGGLSLDTVNKQEGSGSLTTTVAENTLATISLTMLRWPNVAWSGTHTGANGATSLTDANVNFLTVPVRLGSIIKNEDRNFTAIVTRIGDTSQLFFDAGLGTGNTFGNGDVYTLYYHLDSFQLVPGAATGTDNSGVNSKAFSLVDTTKDFVREGVTPGMVLWNTTNGAHGTITSLGQTTNPNDTLHVTGGLTGGSAAVCNSGDRYTVFNDLVKADDWIHCFVRVDFPDRLQYLQVDCDIDGAGYVNNYYSVRLSPNRLNAEANGWTELFIRKSEFHRAGTSPQGWDHIVGIRFRVQTTTAAGGITIWVDDLSLIGGVGIEGDITYTAVYANETTGCLSAPPKDASQVVLFTQKVTAARHPIVLTLTNINSAAPTPPDPQATHLWIYRQGGGLAAAIDPSTNLPALGVFVAAVPKTAVSFTDQRANVQLSPAQILEPDNDPLPTDATVIFGPGALQRLFIIHKRNKVGYSKRWEKNRSRAENWPSTFEFQLGDGSQQALNGIVHDQTIFVYSDSQDWQVLGQGPDAFVPLPIPLSHGLAAQWGLTSGDGQIFKVARDGIYSQQGLTSHKITSDIDPFFLGQTVNGIAPIERTALSACRLAWYPHPQDPEVVLLYPEAGSSVLNKRLVLKKNRQTGQYTDCFFDTTAGVQARSVSSDPQTLTLTYGGDNGRIYQGEVDTVNSDDGAAITGRVRTVAHHEGLPRVVKTYSDVIVQANTGGVPVTVTASFDASTSTVAAGTVTSTTDATMTELLLPQISPPSVLLRHNLALDLTWSATARVAISQLGWHVQPEAQDLTFLDTGDIGFDNPTLLWRVLTDIDTAGLVTKTVLIDGLSVAALSIPGNLNARQRVDVQVSTLRALQRGRTFRVRLSAPTPFLCYGLEADVETEPVANTLWDSREFSFATPHIFRQVLLDLTAPAALTGILYDAAGLVLTSFVLPPTSGRQRVQQLITAAGTLARATLFRLTLASASAFQVWSAAGRFEDEPLPTTFWDSRAIPFEYVHAIKWLGFDIDAPGTITVSTYLDQLVSAPSDVRPLPATAGRQRVNHLLPAGLKGRALRITCESVLPFQPWGLFGLMKAWGSETGYAERSLATIDQQQVTQTILAAEQRRHTQALYPRS